MVGGRGPSCQRDKHICSHGKKVSPAPSTRAGLTWRLLVGGRTAAGELVVHCTKRKRAFFLLFGGGVRGIVVPSTHREAVHICCPRSWARDVNPTEWPCHETSAPCYPTVAMKEP